MKYEYGGNKYRTLREACQAAGVSDKTTSNHMKRLNNRNLDEVIKWMRETQEHRIMMARRRQIEAMINHPKFESGIQIIKQAIQSELEWFIEDPDIKAIVMRNIQNAMKKKDSFWRKLDNYSLNGLVKVFLDYH